MIAAVAWVTDVLLTECIDEENNIVKHAHYPESFQDVITELYTRALTVLTGLEVKYYL